MNERERKKEGRTVRKISPVTFLRVKLPKGVVLG